MLFAQSDDEGLMVLNPHESALGPGRYAVWDDGTVHPVSARAEVLAHELHTCPGLERHRDGR